MLGDQAAVAGFLARDDLRDDHRHAGRDTLMRGRAAGLADDEVARKHERGDPVGPAEHFGATFDRPFDGLLERRVLAHGDGELEPERGQGRGEFDGVALAGIEHQEHARTFADLGRRTRGEARRDGEAVRQDLRGGHALADHDVGGGLVRGDVPVGVRAMPGAVHRDGIGDDGDQARARGVVAMPATGHHVVVERVGRDHDGRLRRVEHRVQGLLDRTHERQRGADERQAVEGGIHAAPETRILVRDADVAVALAPRLLRPVSLEEEVMQLAGQARLTGERFDDRTRGGVVAFAESGREDGDDAHQATKAIVALASPAGAGEAFLAASQAARRSAMRRRSSGRSTTRMVPSSSSTTAVRDSTQSPELM